MINGIKRFSTPRQYGNTVQIPTCWRTSVATLSIIHLGGAFAGFLTSITALSGIWTCKAWETSPWQSYQPKLSYKWPTSSNSSTLDKVRMKAVAKWRVVEICWEINAALKSKMPRVSGNSHFPGFPGMQASNFPSLPIGILNFPSRSREREVLAGNWDGKYNHYLLFF